MSSLNPEKALIFRITHIENVAWILENGLHCRNSGVRDLDYREIGNPDLISKRAHREVPIPPGGTLSDYIPFYFTPFSPMMLNIKTGYSGMKQTPMPDIVIFASSLRTVAEQGLGYVFTDRHAYLSAAEFSSDLDDLDRIDWKILERGISSAMPTIPARSSATRPRRLCTVICLWRPWLVSFAMAPHRRHDCSNWCRIRA